MATALFKEQDHHIWYQSSSDPRDLSERVMDTDSDHQRTIIITVYDARYPITEDVLHKVFDPYGKIEMIHILPEAVHFKALLRFQYHNSVKSAKAGLHGRNIYDGCCRLDLQFLATTFCDCELSKENTIGSVYGDIYELMKEMSSTIDNLISQLKSYKNSTTEKETKTVEPQVFDQLPQQKFMDLSTATVDFHKFESTLTNENQIGEKKDKVTDALAATKAAIEKEIMPGEGAVVVSKMLHLVKEKVSKGTHKVVEACKGMEIEMSRFQVSDKMNFHEVIVDDLHVLNKMVVNDYANYRLHIQRNIFVQILFDPGGYIVPLNLSLDSLAELTVPWIHKNDFLKFGESSSRIDADCENSHYCALVDIKCFMVQCYWGGFYFLRLFILLDPDGFEIECWQSEHEPVKTLQQNLEETREENMDFQEKVNGDWHILYKLFVELENTNVSLDEAVAGENSLRNTIDPLKLQQKEMKKHLEIEETSEEESTTEKAAFKRAMFGSACAMQSSLQTLFIEAGKARHEANNSKKKPNILRNEAISSSNVIEEARQEVKVSLEKVKVAIAPKMLTEDKVHNISRNHVDLEMVVATIQVGAINARKYTFDINIGYHEFTWTINNCTCVNCLNQSELSIVGDPFDFKASFLWRVCAILSDDIEWCLSELVVLEVDEMVGLSRVRHPNFVCLFSCCIEEADHKEFSDQKMICEIEGDNITVFFTVDYTLEEFTSLQVMLRYNFRVQQYNGAYLGLAGNRISTPVDVLYVRQESNYVTSGSLAALKDLSATTFSEDPDQDIRTLLERYNRDPESEPRLRLLLPRIISTFRSNKSVREVIKELENHRLSGVALVVEWGKVALQGINNDLSTFTSVMKAEYRIAIRASLQNDFTEDVWVVLVGKDQNPKWNPSSLEEVKEAEFEGPFEELGPGLNAPMVFYYPKVFFENLDPRGRGLVDPGGNVMTPSYYTMKLEFSSDSYFISI